LSILGLRENSFKIRLPKDFFFEEVENFWKPNIKNIGIDFDSLTEFMNSQIQSITVPEFNMTNLPEQIREGGRTYKHASSTPPMNFFEKSINLSIKSTEGLLTYWVMFDQLTQYLSHVENTPYLPPLTVDILDNKGYAYYTMIFEQIIFQGLSTIELSKDSNSPTFKSFTSTLSYNKIKINFRNGTQSSNYKDIFKN
jgi:hypothetical protein